MYQSLCASRLLYGASVRGPHAFRRVRTSPSLAVPLPLCVRPTPSTSRGSCGLLAAVVSPHSAVRSLVFAEASALPCPHSIFLHAFRYASSLSRLPPPVMHTLPGSGTVTCTSPRAAPPGFPRFSVPALLCPSEGSPPPSTTSLPPPSQVRSALRLSLVSSLSLPPGPGPFLPPSPSPSPSPASQPPASPAALRFYASQVPVPQASPLSYPPGPPSHTRALRLLRTSCLPYQLHSPLPDRRCLACLARGFPDPALHFVRDCPVFYEVRGGFLASSLRRVWCSLLLPSLLLGIRLVWPPAFISSCPCTTPTRSTWPCSAAWGPRTSLDALSPPPRRPLTIPPQPRPQPRPRPHPAVISRFIALAWRAGYPTMTGLSRAPLRRALRVLPLGSRLFQLSEL